MIPHDIDNATWPAWKRVELATGIVAAGIVTPLTFPPHLRGRLSRASLADLSWTGQPDDAGFAYFPLARTADPIGEFQTSGDPVETVDRDLKEIVIRVPAVDRPLAEVKAELIAKAKDDAERERMKYITAGDGKAQEYQEKAREALAYQSDPSPDAADYPMLTAEAEGDGVMLAEKVAEVVARRQAWTVVGAGIAKRSAAGIKAIKSAGSVAAAVAAYAAIDWA